MKVAAHVAYGNVSLKCPSCTGEGAGALRSMEGCDVRQQFGVPSCNSDGTLLPEFVGHFPRMSITCTVCAGKNAQCEVCGGSGEERVFQCPGTVLDDDTSLVMCAYTDFTNGILPDAGGMYDQSAVYVDMMHVVGAELAALQAEEARIRKAKGTKTKTSRR